MRINSIKIEGLFDLFSYDINFKENENVLLITGPNGFGKTMILNIIFSLFNRKFHFFQKLVFKTIVVSTESNWVINIIKDMNPETSTIQFIHLGELVEEINYSDLTERAVNRRIPRFLPIKLKDGEWIDENTDETISNESVKTNYPVAYQVWDEYFGIKNITIQEFLNADEIHFIKEQRLFKAIDKDDSIFEELIDQPLVIETIETYSVELNKLISDNIQKSYIKTQELDSSYLDRLIDEKGIIQENDYDLRLRNLNKKQEKLIEFGISESKQKIRSYSKDDAKALLVYVNDLEQKLSVFDDLIKKLELFTNILNERRFTFKSIKISRDKGFFFKSINGKELELSQLSSGEQHEVVLLYELIFNTKPNMLILIDEPEISLHITWQKEFLNDLLKIIELQKAQVIVATHAPAIINGRWDLVYNLSKEEIA